MKNEDVGLIVRGSRFQDFQRMYNTIQYNNGIYRVLFTKRPGALTQLAVICSAK